jgi:hypothetical protein
LDEIGGFKADSEIGVAFRAGYPCYFIWIPSRTDAKPNNRGYRPRRSGFPRKSDCSTSRRRRQALCNAKIANGALDLRVAQQELDGAQGNRTPMIFITAYFDERIRQSAMEAGAIGI